MTNGESIRFNYSGNGNTFTIQSFTAQSNGLYKLETWGACGGKSRSGMWQGTRNARGGHGGYSCGYVYLGKGQTIYIGVGGISTTTNLASANGGGKSRDSFGNGGGATHIAKTNRGELKNYNNYKNEILIVGSGGGGGGVSPYKDAIYGAGGDGGGLVGGDGVHAIGYYYGTGGTQTKKGDTLGSYDETAGIPFGQGGVSNYGGPGGGGGWYGGGASRTDGGDEDSDGFANGAGGGSAYIGGVPEITFKGVIYTPITISGQNQTGSHGWAVITLIKKDMPTIYLGDIPITEMRLGDIPITEMRLGDIELK